MGGGGKLYRPRRPRCTARLVVVTSRGRGRWGPRERGEGWGVRRERSFGTSRATGQGPRKMTMIVLC
jgi:hypothetical protein